MKVYSDSHDFIPFAMRKKSPKAFANAIKRQSDQISSHYTVVLQNIGDDAMYYLSAQILAIPGTIDLNPSKSVDLNGNYRLLVKKHAFRHVRKTLKSYLPLWFGEHVPIDAQPPVDAYPGDPGVASIAEDGYSSGENSYIVVNQSITSALSYDVSLYDNTFQRHRRDTEDTSSYRLSTASMDDSAKLPPRHSFIAGKASWADRSATRNYPPNPL